MDQQFDPSQPGGTEFNLNEDIFVNGSSTPVDYIGFYTDPSGTQYPVLEGDSAYEILGVEISSNFSALTITPQDFTVCFAAGTLIATPEGEQTVEALGIGDAILTADGGTVPVKWICRQTLHKFFTPAHRFAPVRVKVGALGGGLPHTDLVLTADHALIIDGLAINAGALVNGTTIVTDPADSLPDRVTYYHIETENQAAILANGAPAETFVDYTGHRVFDNYAEYVALYGDDRTIPEMSLPRVSAARLVPSALGARLDGAAVA